MRRRYSTMSLVSVMHARCRQRIGRAGSASAASISVRACTRPGATKDRVAALKEWSWIGDESAEAERLRLSDEFADWSWRARYCGGAFDFGDEADFRRGIDLFVEMIRRRYSRARPSTPMIARQTFTLRAMLYRLRAKFDIAPIAEEEVRAAGWERGDYEPGSLSSP